MIVLVDSDILMEVSCGRDAEIISRWIELSRSAAGVLYSPVSAAELWAGARPPEHDALTNLFRTRTCVPLDEDVGRRAGDYLRRYRKNHGVELGDALVAACAVVNGATLWTRHRKHYPMKELTFF